MAMQRRRAHLQLQPESRMQQLRFNGGLDAQPGMLLLLPELPSHLDECTVLAITSGMKDTVLSLRHGHHNGGYTLCGVVRDGVRRPIQATETARPRARTWTQIRANTVGFHINMTDFITFTLNKLC